MQEMVSKITSIPTGTMRQIRDLRKSQDEGTQRLASDTTGILGVGDTDMTRFLTAPFQNMRMLQVRSGPQMYGTLGIIPDQQHPFDSGTPFFRDGSVRAVDRAGTANFSNNVVRTGPAPDGYTRDVTNNTILILKRIARTFNPAIDRVSYRVDTREVDRDYVLQPDERYDGDFRPSNAMGLGSPFTSPYPVDSHGRRLYNDSPLTDSGWSGLTHTVEYNADTIPVLYSMDPTTYQLPNNAGNTQGVIYGINFTLYQQVVIGTYLTSVSSLFLDSFSFEFPANMAPGIYDVMVVGPDGQIGILANGLTVLAEEGS